MIGGKRTGRRQERVGKQRVGSKEKEEEVKKEN